MPILYTRQENDDKITIIYKYKTHLNISILILFFLALTNLFDGQLIWLSIICTILLTFLIVGFWKPNHEIKKAMTQKKVQISGKNFSFNNPITFTIEK